MTPAARHACTAQAAVLMAEANAVNCDEGSDGEEAYASAARRA
jgi:hypothetical protein